VPAPRRIRIGEALGTAETNEFVVVIDAPDAMVRAAQVTLVSRKLVNWKKTGVGCLTAIVRRDVIEVKNRDRRRSRRRRVCECVSAQAIPRRRTSLDNVPPNGKAKGESTLGRRPPGRVGIRTGRDPRQGRRHCRHNAKGNAARPRRDGFRCGYCQTLDSDELPPGPSH